VTGPVRTVSPGSPVAAALAGRGGDWVDMPVLLPAALVLELSGEALRPRLFFASGVDGAELCLRPDLTVPAARAVAAEPVQGPTVWLQAGKVFRAHNPDEASPDEFLQIGLERFADPDPVAADADVVAAALEACLAGGLAAPVITFSDAALLALVLDGAALADPWGDVLRREAFRPQVLRRRLAEAAAPDPSRLTDLERQLAPLSQAEARDAVAALIDGSGLNPGATRSTDQIADRLAEKARRALAPALPPDLITAFNELLSASGPLVETLDRIVATSGRLDVDLSGWRATWRARIDALTARVPGTLTNARFDLGRARNFGYYDGMNFDIEAGGASRPAASGGRYDSLVEKLGGRPTAAVGCVVRPERLGTIAGGGW
jgi:ATP phosphoribosyltransferase regulatory subunit